MPYTYQRSTDGCDETFDILTPEGGHLVSVHFWDAVVEAEADAKLIVNALNAYKPRKSRKKLSDHEKIVAKARAVTAAALRKPMPKVTVYK